MGGHTQPKPGSFTVKNFDDQTPVKLTRRDVEERAKMVANELIISSDFHFGPHQKRFLYMVLMSLLQRPRMSGCLDLYLISLSNV